MKTLWDTALAAALLAAILVSLAMVAGCCSLSPLERKALSTYQDQHPHMWKHPLPWEDASESWDTCPVRHTAMCAVTGLPMVLTATVWNKPYWDEQMRFWKERHKAKCPKGKDCTCDQVIGAK